MRFFENSWIDEWSLEMIKDSILPLRQHALLVGFWIKTDIYDMYSGLQAETNTDTFKAATMKLSHVFFFLMSLRCSLTL